MSLTRKKLLEAIYRRLSTEYKSRKVSRALVREGLEAILDLIEEALSRGETVSISGFGRFEVRERRQKARDFRTGQIFEIPSQKIIVFRASPKLKRRLR